MSPARSGTASIDIVERRIELRQQRISRHWGEIRTDLVRKSRWAPLAVVAGFAILGVLAGRRQTTRNRQSAVAPEVKGGILATVVALAGGALRFALSPAGRAVWGAYRNKSRPAP